MNYIIFIYFIIIVISSILLAIIKTYEYFDTKQVIDLLTLRNSNIGTNDKLCVGDTCIKEDALKIISQNANDTIAAQIAKAKSSIDGAWIAPCGWKISIRNTLGGKNGQEDWGRTDGGGGWQYQAQAQGNGRWLLTTHNWIFYLATDGRLVSDSGNNNESYKFTKQ
jgi:hypothetical protein